MTIVGEHANTIKLSGLLLLVANTASQACEVPEILAGRELINGVDAHYSPSNPNAGSIVQVKLSTGTYTLEVLGTDVVAVGEYTYQKLHDTVGFLSMREEHPLGPSEYSLTLTCFNDSSGTMVFSQSRGSIKPDARQNTGRYNIVR